jgi:hypothetical protein
MPTYRLDPIKDQIHSHHWRASTLPPQTIWVNAKNPSHARELVTKATFISNPNFPGMRAYPPWKDLSLVTCELDGQHNPAEGIVILGDGKPMAMEN